MKIHPFQATFPHLDLIPSPDSFFSSIKNDYAHYRASGFFGRSSTESIYIQQILSPNGVHQGIIARNSLSDFHEGRVLKHENTLDAMEQSMMNFLLQTKAMVKPVLLAYHKVAELDEIIDKVITTTQPMQVIKFANQEEHTFWEISDGKDIARIQSIFDQKIDKCYIADGHHRCATMLNLADNEHLKKEGIYINHILSAYYSFEELRIFDYNRVVDLLGMMSHARFISRLSKFCRIKNLKKPSKPKKIHHMTLFIGEEWYQLRWRKKILLQHQQDLILLDATLINEYIFNNILKIQDVRTNPRISYVPGTQPTKNLISSIKSQKQKFALFLYPLAVKDLQTAAENNISLPPKSTWFEPRIKSGLLVQEF